MTLSVAHLGHLSRPAPHLASTDDDGADIVAAPLRPPLGGPDLIICARGGGKGKGAKGGGPGHLVRSAATATARRAFSMSTQNVRRRPHPGVGERRVSESI